MREFWAFAGNWGWDPVVALALIAAGVSYGWCRHEVNRAHPSQPWPRRDTACFATGLGLVWLAVLGPIGRYDDLFFWAHMVQHMLLMMLAAPLLVLGSPILLALRVSSPRLRRRVLLPVLRSRVLFRLTDPVLAWALFVAVLVGTHFSGLYEFALEHEWPIDSSSTPCTSVLPSFITIL